MTITISIDAMGGENAPSDVINACSIFLKKFKDVNLMIFGKKEEVDPFLKKFSLDKNLYTFVECSQIVSDEDLPKDSWKNSKDSSMHKAIKSVKEKKSHAIVSCGNTGALMFTAKMLLGSLNNIKRPAIIGILPSNKNKGTIMLDIGANIECNSYYMFQFALMGICFAKVVLEKDNPSVGILNIGSEKTKGRNLEKESFKMFENTKINFSGFIEAHQVALGKVDVLVTDGFSGNIFLKASEGAAKMCLDAIKESIFSGLFNKLIGFFIKQKIKKNLEFLNPDKNNGAMFIGLDGIVVKSHGNSKVSGILNGIETAYNLAKSNINSKIINELELFEKEGIGLTIVNKLKKTSAKIFGIE